MEHDAPVKPEQNNPELSSTVEPSDSLELLAREEAQLDRAIFAKGEGEMFSGFFIALATLGMCGIEYQIPYLKWIRGSFYMIFVFTYVVAMFLTRRALKRKHPELSNRNISQYVDTKTSPIFFAIVPVMVAIFMAILLLQDFNVKIPPQAVKTLAMLLCFGFFAGFCWVVFGEHKIWRWLVWGTLAFTIMLLMGFSVINLNNFTLLLLPYGLLVFIAGAVVNVLKSRELQQ